MRKIIFAYCFCFFAINNVSSQVRLPSLNDVLTSSGQKTLPNLTFQKTNENVSRSVYYKETKFPIVKNIYLKEGSEENGKILNSFLIKNLNVFVNIMYQKNMNLPCAEYEDGSFAFGDDICKKASKVGSRINIFIVREK